MDWSANIQRKKIQKAKAYEMTSTQELKFLKKKFNKTKNTYLSILYV